MKEYILSKKAQNSLGELLLAHFWVWDHEFRVDTDDISIDCELCGKETEKEYYILHLNDFGIIRVCVKCFKTEIKIIESKKE